ncbi:uncharacterized protein LOC108904305 [Anoplophora glabripennis]|uniref:uncharacterized protein LOC108904305 n=1 Tax=Anoplophora glabripennis TaxID=217634 RepID=UPI000873C88F|nr:uncharacterized protein LOC108904305 [Anoplophora glabripennis]
MNKAILLLIFGIYFAKSNAQCDKDKNYKYYHTLIGGERDNIQKVFDGILEKYGNINKILEDLLSKLNKTINKANSGLNQLEKYNSGIKENNDDSNAKLEPLLDSLKAIEDEIKQIKFNKSWPLEREDAEISANKTVHRPASTDITEQEEELAKWKKFLEQLNGHNYTKDIMNVPHSVSDELDLLEKLITEGPSTNCFSKFHNDLKLLFLQLANLFVLSVFKDNVDNLKNKASQNKKNADDVLSGTKKFLDKEKELEDIYHLTNETLALAEEIEKLKAMINNLSGHNEDVIKDRLKQLQEEHQAEIEKLNEKYNVKEGQQLLNELKRTKEQIENVNIEDVEKDIDNYSRELNYYICVLEKCEKGNETISSCEPVKM